MATKRDQLVIEITEDAYKQNSVYRPWDEAKEGGMTTNSGTALTQQQAVRALAAVGRVLAAAGIPG
jgi:hypothetical protein